MQNLNDLINIMRKLRGDSGCPWDRKQTHETIKENLIEECYEVLEAIDTNDNELLLEELGDVLFQVVFHSQIATEENEFNIEQVIDKVCTKMITRHPKVFKLIEEENDENNSWNAIKRKERGCDNKYFELKHIANNLPALIRCEKVQKESGIIKEHVEESIVKLTEGVNKLKKIYNLSNEDEISNLIGNILFLIVMISNDLNIKSEFALNNFTNEFINEQNR